MVGRRRLAVVAGAALAAVGGGVGYAAATGSPSEESQAVIDDAAKQLGIESARLGNALKQALANRVDAAVADGRLTQARGEELKERIRSGELPLVLGVPHQRGGFGFGHHGRKLETAAAYLGLTEAALRAELQSGKTLAQVAEAKGKPVSGLVDALVAEAKTRLDAAVRAGRLTRTQADELLAGLRGRITAHVNGQRPDRGHGSRRGALFPRPAPPLLGPAA